MVDKLEIRALSRSDDRSGFSSGDGPLDEFLWKNAGQAQFRYFTSVTYVAVLDERVVGYVSIHASEMRPPPGATGFGARRSLPVLCMGRLAVDQRFAGNGIGKSLLRHVLKIVAGKRTEIGCAGLLVKAYRHRKSFYADLGFIELEGEPGENGSAEVAGTALMFLKMKDIIRAIGR